MKTHRATYLRNIWFYCLLILKVKLLLFRLFATPWTAACQVPCPSQSPRVAQTHVHWVGDAIQLSHHPLSLLFLLPSVFPSIRVLSSESALRIRWPKYWSFSFSINPSHEYSALISFRMGWLDLLALQGISRVFSNNTVQKHQFFGNQLSLWSNSHWKNHSLN